MDETNVNKQNFWNIIENSLCITVSIYIKNILAMQHLDNPLTFLTINEDVVDELVNFVRSPVYESNIPQDENKKNYYGIYDKHKENFEFTIGDRSLFKIIRKFVDEKGSKFWKKVYENKKDSTNKNKKYSLQSLDGKKLSNDKDKIMHLLQKTQKLPKNVESFLPEIKIDIASDNNYVIAKITCPICDKQIKITKTTSKWSLFNIRRHLMKHGSSKTIKSSTKKGRDTTTSNIATNNVNVEDFDEDLMETTTSTSKIIDTDAQNYNQMQTSENQNNETNTSTQFTPFQSFNNSSINLTTTTDTQPETSTNSNDKYDYIYNLDSGNVIKEKIQDQ